MTADAWVSLLVLRAAELREAGVTRLSVDGCSATLAPSMSGSVGMPEQDPQPLLDPLDDPMTFGGPVPGYSIPASAPAPIDGVES